jgi:tetratricopeptide (TPR) repeat protein
MPQPLHLDVAEFSPDAWRWTLTDHADAYIQHDQVRLDLTHTCYRALLDLPGYLRVHAAPDRRQQDERRLIAEVGDYVGAHVLGEAIGRKLRERSRPSVVVRVRVPASAQFLLTLPLEIARIDGAPLAGVSFVFQAADETPPAVEPIGERLRLLALFSVPPDGNALNLRRERQMLRQLVGQLAGAAGRAVDLRVLQYGVTRDSLKQVLEEGEGWDVIHFSGHGLPGALVLEKPDGATDRVSSTDLSAMLAQAGARVKLVVLSACLSAAASIEQSLRWLGLDPASAPLRDMPAYGGAPAAPTVAQALTQSLGCAVVAMRYAVEDEFASNFGRALYEQLFENGNALPEAARLALSHTAGPAGALSGAAASLFGARAAELKLNPPEGDGFELNSSLDYVPDPREHFVGRVAAMIRASAALARSSKKSGVLFHGMAGGGKTSCALELIHHHGSVRRFQTFVWFAAPEPGKDIEPALRNFALAMERELPEFKMAHVIGDAAEFTAWLPRLTRLLAQRAVLIALDNVESLLSDSGQWLDPRWAALVRALLTQGGLSRLVLTSRVVPTDLPGSAEVIAVHALARDEAVLLAMEMPALRRLLDGEADGMAKDDQRLLVRQVLRQAQGHPKLLDLAEQLAADPAKLQAEVGKFDAANPVPAAELDAFLQGGASKLDVATFMASLRAWTSGIAATLPEAPRLAFHFLCALEQGDREGLIIAGNWGDLWGRLGHAAPAPDFAPLLAALVRAGLVEQRATGDEPDDYTITIHPGVAEAGRAEAGAAVQAAVDHELAATWHQTMSRSEESYGKKPTGAAIVRAGLAAFPYLARLGEWETAAAMLERSVQVDKSPEAIAAALPMAQRIARGSAGTDREAKDMGLLASILSAAGRGDEAEALMRASIDSAAEREDFATASAASGDLANLLRASGRAAAALDVVDRMADFTRRAGQGPWTQLTDKGWRLQILNELGRWDEVMQDFTGLRAHMATLPDPPDANDRSINVWNVREGLLDTGRGAALRLEQWQVCLDLNAEILHSREARGAPALERARTRFNDYGPLIGLRRYSEARALLEACLATYQRENAIPQMAGAYSALAELEDALGHHETARALAETSIRLRYISSGPGDVAISHFNYSNCLTKTAAQPRLILAHRLAAILLGAVIQSGELASDIAALGRDLSRLGPDAAAALPGDIATLRATVEQIEGVKFGDMLRRFIEDDAQATGLLQAIIAKAQEAQP